MSQDQTLSGEEISALMSEARESGSAEGGASASPARAFSLGGDAGRSMAAIPALDRLNERMVKRLRDVIEPFARVKPRVSTVPTEVRAFGDWRAEQNEFASLSLYAFRPLKGAILLAHRARIRQPAGRRLLRRQRRRAAAPRARVHRRPRRACSAVSPRR